MEIIKFKDPYYGEYGIRTKTIYGIRFYDLDNPSMTYDIGDVDSVLNGRGSLSLCRKVLRLIEASKDEGIVNEDY